MQAQRHIADRVREIEPYAGARPARGCDDRGEIQSLAGEVLYAGQQHERQPRALALEAGNEILRTKAAFARARRGFDQVLLRVKSVIMELRNDRVAIG
jgi:hypothetical protein